MLFALQAKAQPCTVDQPTNQVLCSGAVTSQVNFTGGTIGTIYHWTNTNPDIGLSASGTGFISSFTAVNNTGSPQIATITVTATGRTKDKAYISNYSARDVSVINTITNTVIADIPVGWNPYGVGISLDNKKIFVPNLNGSIDGKEISIIDKTTNNVSSTIHLPSIYGATSVALTPDDKKAYVACYGSNLVVLINTLDNSIVTTIPVGNSPFGTAMSPNGNLLYVSNNNATGSVSVINTNSNTVVSTVPVGGAPHGLAITPEGKKVYITNMLTYNPAFPGNTVSVMNTSTNTIIKTIPVDMGPIAVAISPDGSKAYVGNNYSNNISVISTDLDTVIATITGINLDPTGISITPDGKELYLENADYNTVSVINTDNNTIIKTIPVGLGNGFGNGPINPGNFISSIPCTSLAKTFTITVNPQGSGVCANNNTVNECISAKLLPNIISDHGLLRVNSCRNAQINWLVFDAIGRKLTQFFQSVNPGQTDLPLHLDFLPDGAYFIRGTVTNNEDLILRFLRLR